MKSNAITLISLIFCLYLPHPSLTTPVFIWSNRDHQLSGVNTHYLGNDLTFFSFDYQILDNIKREAPDVIFAFVTSPLSLDDLTTYGTIYAGDNGNACIHNTKTAIQNSLSSLFIDELLPGSNSILTDLKRSFSNFGGYKMVQISSDDEFTDNLKLHDRLIVIISSALPSLQDSLKFADERISSLLQIAEENALDYISILLGDNHPVKLPSRYVREATPLTTTTGNPNNTLQFIVRLNESVMLFRAQNISVRMNSTDNKNNNTIQLFPNNTEFSSGASSSNHTESFFEISTTALQSDTMWLKFVFPNGTSRSNLTANMTLLRDYWSMMIVLSLGTNKTTSLSFFPPKKSLIVPFGFSYHCTPTLQFTVSDTNYTGMMVIISGLQVQPFGVANASEGIYSFSSSDDCVGYFTLDIWMGIFASFIIFTMLYCAIMGLMSISTSDRLDDPQGKPLMVEGTSH